MTQPDPYPALCQFLDTHLADPNAPPGRWTLSGLGSVELVTRYARDHAEAGRVWHLALPPNQPNQPRPTYLVAAMLQLLGVSVTRRGSFAPLFEQLRREINQRTFKLAVITGWETLITQTGYPTHRHTTWLLQFLQECLAPVSLLLAGDELAIRTVLAKDKTFGETFRSLPLPYVLSPAPDFSFPWRYARRMTEMERHAVETVLHSDTPTLRQRAAILLASEAGGSPAAVAAQVGCHASTVQRVITAWNQQGLATLASRWGNKLPRTFSPAVIQWLRQALRRSPRDFGEEADLWTREIALRVCLVQGVIPRPSSPSALTAALADQGLAWEVLVAESKRAAEVQFLAWLQEMLGQGSPAFGEAAEHWTLERVVRLATEQGRLPEGVGASYLHKLLARHGLDWKRLKSGGG